MKMNHYRFEGPCSACRKSCRRAEELIPRALVSMAESLSVIAENSNDDDCGCRCRSDWRDENRGDWRDENRGDWRDENRGDWHDENRGDWRDENRGDWRDENRGDWRDENRRCCNCCGCRHRSCEENRR